jgi:drug/metabolite transporter (DMT)-like permease
MLAWTAALPAFSLGGTLFFQTWGMQHTTATNSSFITILYVVFVPLLETIVLRKAPPRILWLWIVAALAGAALMCRLHELKLNVGDMLTLCCAFLAAVHILLTGWAVRRIQSPFLFNGWTAVMSAALLWPLAVATEGWPHLPTELTPWLGIAYLSLVSTLVAFLLQVRAQRVLSPSLSSMLFLLESPFGALFAYAVLGERLLPGQWLGAGIILIAAFGATRSCES